MQKAAFFAHLSQGSAFWNGMRTGVGTAGRLAGAFKGLGIAFKSFMLANPLIVLAAVAGFAFAAYENNWLSFKGVVDSLTTSFRNLDEELNSAFTNILDKQRIIRLFGELGAESADTFRGGFIEEAKSQGPLLDIILGGQQTFAEITGIDVLDMAFKSAAASATDLWSRATLGAQDNREAIANINAELASSNLDIMQYWKAWELGRGVLALTGAEASRFGEAVARTLADGSGDVKELTANFVELGGSSSFIDQVSDSMLDMLGITTRAAEATGRTVAESIAQSKRAIDEMMRDNVITDAERTFMAAHLERLVRAMNAAEPEVARAIQEYIDHVNESLGGAENFIDMVALEEGIVEALSSLDIKSLPKTTFAELQAAIAADIQAAWESGVTEVDYEGIIQSNIEKMNLQNAGKWVRPELEKLAASIVQTAGETFKQKKEAFLQALKGIQPDEKAWKQWASFINNPQLHAALAGEFGIGGRNLGLTSVEEFYTEFQSQWSQATPDQRIAMGEHFSALFDQESYGQLPADLQQFAAWALSIVWENLDEPAPAWLVAAWEQHGIEIPTHLQTGIDSVTITPPEVPQPTVPDFTPSLGKYTAFIGLVQGALTTSSTTNPVVGPGIQAPNFQPTVDKYGNVPTNAQTAIDENSPVTGPAVQAPPMDTARQAYTNFAQHAETTLGNVETYVPPPVPPDVGPAKEPFRELSVFVAARLAFPNAYTWGSHLVTQFSGGITDSVYIAQQAARDLARAASGPIKFSTPPPGPLRNVRVWGQHLVDNWTAGMWSRRKKVASVSSSLAEFAAKIIRMSAPPSEGPLRDIITWGEHFVDNWTKGMLNSQSAVAYAASVVAGTAGKALQNEIAYQHSMLGARLDTSYNYDKKIELYIYVQSPDGSVDRVRQSDIRDAVRDALDVTRLRHMVTVDH
jgi:hypothetical protein